MNFYISDTHFGSSSVIEKDSRPFSDELDMFQLMRQRWNAQVSHADTVYVLGDFEVEHSVQRIFEYAEQLNGHKVFILGNHEHAMTAEEMSVFCKLYSVHDLLEIEDGAYHVTMCHYPMPFYARDCNSLSVMLHGHVHRTPEADLVRRFHKECEIFSTKYQWVSRCQLINVGCMLPYMNYTPQPLSKLAATLQAGEG